MVAGGIVPYLMLLRALAQQKGHGNKKKGAMVKNLPRDSRQLIASEPGRAESPSPLGSH
jgi:hypothetical protein